MISILYNYYYENTDTLPVEYFSRIGEIEICDIVCDYIAGMTDRYALKVFQDIFVPSSWN